MRKILQSQKGESLIEVVLSLALFSVIMTMLASMYFTAMRVTKNNYDTERKVDRLVSAAVEQQFLPTDSSKEEVTFTLGDGHTVVQKVLLKETKLTDTTSLYQFSKE